MTTLSTRTAVRGAAILALVLLWEGAGRALGPARLAPPSIVLPECLRLLRDGTTLAALASSLEQMLVGYAFACAIGVPLGVAMGRSRAWDALFHPWVSMCVVTSVAALVPLFIVILGTGFWFRVGIVFVAAVWFPILTTYHGARGIDQRWLDAGRSLAAGRLQLFAKVVLPALYPHLITGARLGLVHAIRAMVVAEMFIIVGYGGLIYNSGLAVSTAPLLGLILNLMVVGVAATGALRWLARVVAPWYEERVAPS